MQEAMTFEMLDESPGLRVNQWAAEGVSRLNRRFFTTAATVALALLFFAGDIKNSSAFTWIPFDLTAIVAVALVIFSALSLLAGGGKVSRQILWMCALFFLLAMASLWTQWTSYALDKAVRLFTIALAAALLPGVVLTRLWQVRLFVALIILSGMLISSGEIVQLLRGATISEKITGISSGSVSLGRSAGIALVGLFTWATAGRIQRYWWALLCVPLFLILVASGSRGPVIFAVAVAAFVALRWSIMKIGSAVVISLLLVAVALLIAFGPPLPQQSVKRIEDFLTLRYDNSSLERVYAGRTALTVIEKTPAGLGIGGFGRVYNFGHVTNRVYPHNLVLEIAAECGWIPAAFFVLLMFLALRRAYRAARADPRLRPFFAVLLFAFGNSLVSGDANDNRIVYALICVALQCTELIRQSLAEDAQTSIPAWASR
jgi:O-antigen ligase